MSPECFRTLIKEGEIDVYKRQVSTMLTKIRDVASALVNGQLTPEQAGKELDAEVEMYSE